MKKRSRKPKSPLEWHKHLDAGAIEAAREEALLDAYGDDEQRAALASMAASELVCPFQASVIGRHVPVVDISESESGYSVDLTVEVDGEQFIVDARSVELVKPFPEGVEFLAAMLMEA